MQGLHINVIRTSNLKEIREALLESVIIDEEGELCPRYNLIYFTGTGGLSEVIQSEHNTTYLVVNELKSWRHLKSKKVSFFSVKPSQYQHIVEVLRGVMEPAIFSYYWSEYCVDRFASNPYRWYNEVRYLMYLYQQKQAVFTRQDLDVIYNRISSNIVPYLSNVFTPEGRKYIAKMTNKEMMTIFVGGGNKKGLIESIIVKLHPEKLHAYYMFKQSFWDARVRLHEGAYLLDYVLNKETCTNATALHLFRLK